MKKVLVSGLLLISLLAMTTGVAFAGSALELVAVKNDGGGPTFVFRVTGEFSESELNGGFVSVEGGEDYPLYCEQIDADTVVCHTSKKTGGHDVVVGFGGARFWVFVPDQNLPICTPVYDWSWPTPSTYWQYIGDYCAKQAPQDGDVIYQFFNPIWGGGTYWDYYYAPDGVTSSWSNPGPGFYY